MGLNTQRTRGTFILFGVFHALTRCVPWLRTLRWLYQPHGSVTGDGDGASMGRGLEQEVVPACASHAGVCDSSTASASVTLRE